MSNRIEGERVFCYQCENEWDRAHGGLQCPRCESEFVEILAPGARPNAEDPPEVSPDVMDLDREMRPIREHNPWDAPDPDEGDIRTIHFNTGGGGQGTSFSFSRTYTTGFGGPRQQQRSFNSGGQDPAADDIMRSFESMVNNLLGGGGRPGMRSANFGGSVNINGRTTHFGAGSSDDDFPGPMPMGMGPGSPPTLFGMLFPGANGARGPGGAPPMGGLFDMLSMMQDPRNAQRGDHVFSQEAFDRVMSQLMEQNQQNGAPPAPRELIDQLPKKPVDKSMLGDDQRAECSICMDNVEIGTEVTVLPCQHWFHFECIESWLKEHDTCPHCRKPITPEDQRNQRPTSQRRSSRRSSSVASPFANMHQEGSRQNPVPIPDSPSAMRAAREQYYGRSRSETDRNRPSSERRSSRRSTGSQRDEGGGGVGGWIRSHNPFS